MKKKNPPEKIEERKDKIEPTLIGKTHIGFIDKEGHFQAIPMSKIRLHEQWDTLYCSGYVVSKETFLKILCLLGLDGNPTNF